MNLRVQAAADLKLILEDSAAGFGWPITVTSPAGVVGSLVGFSNDISQTIDPETGIAVSGRNGSVAIAIASLVAVGLGIPSNVSEKSSKPWRVRFNDLVDGVHEFKVIESFPDRSLGIVTCRLDFYTPPP